MQQKVFIGIDLDPSIKKSLAKNISEWTDVPVRWFDEHNFHIPLVSLGWVGEGDVLDVQNILTEITDETSVFSVDFSRIVPIAKDLSDLNVAHAKSVKLVGEESDELKDLYQKIVDALNIPVGEKKTFRPLVDLGKIRATIWEQLDSHPDLSKDFPIAMDVFSITLFENHSVEGKCTFTPIEVFDLQ